MIFFFCITGGRGRNQFELFLRYPHILKYCLFGRFLYIKISLKAKQLYVLGISYQKIAKSLNVGGSTIVSN